MPKCPSCQSALSSSVRTPGAAIVCPACGAKMRVKPRPRPTTPQAPASDVPLGAAAWLPPGILSQATISAASDRNGGSRPGEPVKTPLSPSATATPPPVRSPAPPPVLSPTPPPVATASAVAAPATVATPTRPAQSPPELKTAPPPALAPTLPPVAAPSAIPGPRTVATPARLAEPPPEAKPTPVVKKKKKKKKKKNQPDGLSALEVGIMVALRTLLGALGVLVFQAYLKFRPGGRFVDDELDGKSSRKRSKGRASGPETQTLVLAGAGMVVLLAVMVFVVVPKITGWFRQPAAGPARSGREVVFDSPLSPSELAAALPKDAPARPAVFRPTPNGATAAVAVLPAVASTGAADSDPPAAWSGRPDAPSKPPEKLPIDQVFTFGARNQVRLAGMNAPFVLEAFSEQRDVAMRPQLHPTFGADSNPQNKPLPVFDLRTGERHARFAWWMLPDVWTRLSPDGRTLVSPDHNLGLLATVRDGELFVWTADRPAPGGRLKLPGGVTWLEFVANHLLAVLTFDRGPVLQVWDVTKAELLRSIELPLDEFPPPKPGPGLERLVREGVAVKPYDPSPWIGAVSPRGRLVALGGASGVSVVSLDEGQVVGTLPLPRRIRGNGPGGQPLPGPQEYRGVGFSPDGRELHALMLTDSVALVSWSMETGRPTRALALGPKVHPAVGIAPRYSFRGAPLPGPTPSTLLLPLRETSTAWRLGQKPTFSEEFDVRIIAPGALISASDGFLLGDIDFLPIRSAGPGRLLAFANLANRPDLPLPGTDSGGGPRARRAAGSALRHDFRALYVVRFDAETYRSHLEVDTAGNGKGQEPRPPAQPGDRAGLAATKPEPPPTWSRPPAPPAPADGLKKVVGTPSTRPLFGDSHVGFLGLMPSTSRLLAAPRGVFWFRYDLHTGEPAGEPLHLWPWIASTDPVREIDPAKVPLAASMSRDGRMVALRDAADSQRVDVWDEKGRHILGLIPYDSATPVQWVGWSAKNRLLTLGGGKLTGWEVPSGKAAFETSGGYQLPTAEVRGRAWLAIAAGPHIDLLDTDSGRCLGRLTPTGGGPPGGFDDLAVALDGSMVACLPAVPKPKIEAADPKPDPAKPAAEPERFVTGWDLATGKALATVAVPLQPVAPQLDRSPNLPRAMVALDSRRVMVGNDLIDLNLAIHLATFTYPSGRGYGEGHLPDSPDGRPWGIFLPMANMAGNEAGVRHVDLAGYNTAADRRDQLFTKEVPLTVEVDLGDRQKSRAFGQAEVARLQSDGFKIGPGDWRLVFTHKVVDTEQHLTDGTIIPALESEWALYAPDGSKAWSSPMTLRFDNTSKYYRGSRDVTDPYKRRYGVARDVLHKYDFGLQPAREAILDELFERSARPSSAPSLAGPFQGRYQALPVAQLVSLQEPGAAGSASNGQAPVQRSPQKPGGDE